MNRIRVLYGNEPKKMAFSMMTAMKVDEELRQLGEKDIYIGLKPNLVVAQPSHWGATTSPELVEGVICYLKEHGFHHLAIMESSWVGDSTAEAFRVCGYTDLKEKYKLPLIDLKKDRHQQVVVEDMDIAICREPLQVDYLINLPVLKAHCQTKITCALKNLKGCIPDREKKRFHRLGLHKPIACLGKALKPNLTIVDSIIGDLTHEEGGNPVSMGRIIGGRDPVLLDAYAAELLGYEVQDIPYIPLAAQLGAGSLTLTPDAVVELNQNDGGKTVEVIEPGYEVDYLRQWILEDQACSACVGSLIHALMRIKEQNYLESVPRGIAVGQGFKGSSQPGLGIGACTSGLSANVPGCPPKAKEIKAFLDNHLLDRN